MQQVEIRVKGRIDKRWSEWLAGLAITHTGQGETLLMGSVLDQAELYGLMSKLRDLGLSLSVVHCVELGATAAVTENTAAVDAVYENVVFDP